MMYNTTNIFETEIASRFIDNLFAIKGAKYASFESNKCYFLDKDYNALAVMNNLLSKDYTYIINREMIEVVLVVGGNRFTNLSIQAAIDAAKTWKDATVFLRYKPFGIEEKLEYKDYHITGIRLKHHRKVVNEGNFDIDLYREANKDFAVWHDYLYDNIRF